AENARLVLRRFEGDVRGRHASGHHQGRCSSSDDDALPRPSPPRAGRLTNLFLEKLTDGTAALTPHRPRWWDVVDLSHCLAPVRSGGRLRGERSRRARGGRGTPRSPRVHPEFGESTKVF